MVRRSRRPCHPSTPANMSAQVLLSVAAPALPAAPPATADAGASDFKGFLGEAMSGVRTPGDARPDRAVKTKADSDVGTPAGFLTPPVALPTPTPVLTAPATGSTPEEPTDALTAASDAATGSAGPPDRVPVPEAAPAPSLKDAAAIDKPTPGQTAVPAKGSGETVVPVKGMEALVPPEGGKTAPADAAKAAVAALELVAAASRAQSPEPAASVAPVAAPVTPPPLRALPERTSSPLEPEAKTATSLEPAKAAASAPAAGVSSSVSDQPVRAVESAPPPQLDAMAADPGSNDPTSPTPGQAEGPTAQAQAHAVVHETTPSQISRASLDATAQIAAQIVRKLEGRSTRFEMALTPDDLGRVDVKLDIDSDGRLAARLAFDNPLAATDLKGRADELRRQLQDAGFQLADNALEFADRDSSSSAFDRGGDARKGQNRAFTAASRLNAEIDVAQPPRWMALSLTPSGLDLKV